MFEGLHFNWADGAVVAIILGFALAGLFGGFVNSVFKIASFFLSIFLAVKFYPPVSQLMMKTQLYSNVKNSIMAALTKQNTAGAAETASTAGQSGAAAFVDKLPLPQFLKENVLAQLPQQQIFDLSKLTDQVSAVLAGIVISIISLALLFIVIRLALILVRFLLQGLAKLPVFKQLDRTGGFALGAVEGILAIFILMSVLALFNSSAKFTDIYNAVNTSVIADFFYQNNFIITWMLGS